ncbi:MAG: heme exporter protein CcmD [Legionellales bacterium]
MNQFLEWLAMGGYATYVWSAYGLVCTVLVVNVLGIKWQKKRTHQKLQQWFKS